MKKPFILATIAVILAVFIGAFVAQQYLSLKNVGESTFSNPINTGARNVTFTSWELQAWASIKNRVIVYNADPELAGNRGLQWISMRNSTSAPWDNYYQKSMEFLCFWSGQGASGEWEAVVSIYNKPNSTSVFVVEFSRFTWHSLDLIIDGVVMHSFPQVTDNGAHDGYYSTEIQA